MEFIYGNHILYTINNMIWFNAKYQIKNLNINIKLTSYKSNHLCFIFFVFNWYNWNNDFNQ